MVKNRSNIYALIYFRCLSALVCWSQVVLEKFVERYAPLKIMPLRYMINITYGGWILSKTFDQSTAVPESVILLDKAIRQADSLLNGEGKEIRKFVSW